MQNKTQRHKKKNRSYECDVEVTKEDAEYFNNIRVPESTEGGDHYKKENCCPYCSAVRLRMADHIRTMHWDTRGGTQLIVLTEAARKFKRENSDLTSNPAVNEKRKLMAELKAHGNDKHNTDPKIVKSPAI